MVSEVGYKLYAFGTDEEELVKTFQYHLIRPGRYCLVYDRGEKPAGSALIDGEKYLLLDDTDKEWLASTITEIASRINAAVAYDEKTGKYQEFISALREELEKERQRLLEDDNE